jgi:hypothetical protein
VNFAPPYALEENYKVATARTTINSTNLPHNSPAAARADFAASWRKWLSADKAHNQRSARDRG